ncbi:MAG: ATP-binding cassette domain-containing protein, partial [Haemophilus parainfluenzae]|nr:ATP-binding cassette domain-containing protein [Haemophilus parainfluenzae]
LETITSGDLFIGDTRMNDIPPAERGVGMVFQSYALYPHLSVAENMSFGLKLAGAKKETINQRVTQVAEVLQLAHLLERKPKALSGGQRQRIAIARGLMLDPDVVVADEPVSALDVSVRAQVLNLMMDLQAELGLSYVFISHDLSVVEHIADEVMVMYLGRCVEMGSKEQIFANPQHPYTQALLSATPRLSPELRRQRIKLTGELPSPINPPKGCAFNPRCWKATDKCRNEQPKLEKYPDGKLIACFHLD